MLVALYIALPNLTSTLCSLFLSGKTDLGSDHAIHIDIIRRIKANRNRFLTDYIFSINEKNIFYPQLYHWILSFLPHDYPSKHYHVINFAVKLLDVTLFNLFVLYTVHVFNLSQTVFLYANLIYNVFPFSYSAWNAKNMGISARHIGLILGQSYCYLLFAYSITHNPYIFILLLLLVFVILLTSQMALQFVLLGMPLIATLLHMPEIAVLPFLAFAVFFMLMPTLAKKFVIGQFHHKRNYALFLGDIFILKVRPGIYRDFVWDFWIKLRANFKNGINYIAGNPLVELIYGFPFLWACLAMSFPVFSQQQQVLFYIVITGLVLFFFTSFRFTRFLGEPQRYVEFTIPIITILFVLNFEPKTILLSGFVALLFTALYVFITNRYLTNSPARVELTETIRKLTEPLPSNSIVLCNDNQLAKRLQGMGYLICLPVNSDYYATKNDFLVNYEGDFAVISKIALSKYINTYPKSYLLLNTKYYAFSDIPDINRKNIQLLSDFNNYSLYFVAA